MPLPKTEYIWMNENLWNGTMQKFMSYRMSFIMGQVGSKGLRAYNTKKGTAIFRLPEHIHRLALSVKSIVEKCFRRGNVKATIDLVNENNLQSCYIRPVVHRGYGERLSANMSLLKLQ